MLKWAAAIVTLFLLSVAAAGASLGYQGPLGIAAAPDGTFWWAQQSTSSIGFRAPDGCFYSIALPRGLHTTSFAAAASNGSIWLTDYRDGAIIEIRHRAAHHFLTGTHPLRIAADSDGSAWFVEGRAAIGHISPAGRIEHYKIPNNESVGDVAADNGLVAISDTARGEIVFLREGRVLRRMPLGAQSRPTSLRFLGNGTLAVFETGAQKVSFVNGNAVSRSIPIPMPAEHDMSSMAVDGLGVWVASGTSVMQIAKDGSTTRFTLRSGAGGIATSGDTALVTEGYDTIAVIREGTLQELNINRQLDQTLHFCRTDLLPHHD